MSHPEQRPWRRLVPAAVALAAALAATGCPAQNTVPEYALTPMPPVPPVQPVSSAARQGGSLVVAAEPECGEGRAPCDDGGKARDPRCSNGSTTDCNVHGTTLLPESAWVDPAPPLGWQQCAGFLNSKGDDVAANFLDNCLGATRLRLRVYKHDGQLEEDIASTGFPSHKEWPNFNYLSGSPQPEIKSHFKATHWGETIFFTTTDGKDACLKRVAPGGTTFGSDHANKAVIVGGGLGADEYRINCDGPSLPERRIAIYRQGEPPLQQAE